MKTTLLFVVLALSGLSVLSAKVVREYHHVKIPKTWAEAKSYCRERFTDLASVDNKANNEKLLSVTRGHGAHAWIGLFGGLTAWKWAYRGVDLRTFSNWKSGEPDIKILARICAVMTENGEWSTSHCHTRRPAVCYHEQGPSTYILVENRTRWHDAVRYCRSRYTDLVSARNVSENQNISSLLSTDTWIGLHRHYWNRWSDSTHRGFNYWDSGQPDDIASACGLINTVTGKWRDTDCKEEHYFVCQTVENHKTTLKLKFQSEADLNDPAVQQQILEQLHAKLDEHVLPDFKLRWIETDGQTFHKEQKREEEEEEEEEGESAG